MNECGVSSDTVLFGLGFFLQMNVGFKGMQDIVFFFLQKL